MDVSKQDNSSLESQKQEFLKLGVPEKNILVEVKRRFPSQRMGE
jgi:hypothetical protein